MQPELNSLAEKLRREGSLLLEIQVSPRASRSMVSEVLPNGALKVRVAALPEKGEANRELVACLAEFFGVARTRIRIVSGESSHHKRVRID